MFICNNNKSNSLKKQKKKNIAEACAARPRQG